MGASEKIALTGEVISVLMDFLSPVEGAGSHPTVPSRASTAVPLPCSAQSPGRQVDLFLCVTDR